MRVPVRRSVITGFFALAYCWPDADPIAQTDDFDREGIGLALIKIDWNTLFGGISASIAAIQVIRDYISSRLQPAKIVCTIPQYQIGALQRQLLLTSTYLLNSDLEPVSLGGNGGALFCAKAYLEKPSRKSANEFQNALRLFLERATDLLEAVNSYSLILASVNLIEAQQTLKKIATSLSEINGAKQLLSQGPPKNGLLPPRIVNDITGHMSDLVESLSKARDDCRQIITERQGTKCP